MEAMRAAADGRDAQAYVAIRRYLKRQIDGVALNDLAVIANRLGRREEALSILRAVLAIDADQVDALTNLAALQAPEATAEAAATAADGRQAKQAPAAETASDASPRARQSTALSSQFAQPAVAVTGEVPLRRYWRARLQQALTDKYLGVQMIKFPEDLKVYENLLWIDRVNTVIEIGTRSGGSTLWFRDRLETLQRIRRIARPPQVISIDIDMKTARANIDAVDPHWQESVTLIEGDVCDPGVREQVASKLMPDARCLVIEDSAHIGATTQAALELYSDLVSVGGFFIVEDGVVDVDELRIDPNWPRGVLPALTQWLATPQGRRFQIHRELEVYGVTSHPLGFLQRMESPPDA